MIAVPRRTSLLDNNHHHNHRHQQQKQQPVWVQWLCTVELQRQIVVTCQSQLILAHLYHHQHHLVPLHRPRDPAVPASFTLPCHVTSCRPVSGLLVTCLAAMSATPTTHQPAGGLRIVNVALQPTARPQFRYDIHPHVLASSKFMSVDGSVTSVHRFAAHLVTSQDSGI